MKSALCIAQLLPEDERYLADIVKGADGNVYMLKTGMDEGTEMLCKIVDDKLEEDIELKDFKDASNPDMYYSVDLVDKNGNYVMSYEGGLRICGKDSNELFSKPLSNGYICGCANTKDGDIAVYYESYENDQTANKVMIIGTDSYEVKKEITLNDQLTFNNPIMDGFGDYDFLYMSNTALFGYDIASENAIKLVGFNDSNINIDACSGIYMINPNTLIVDKTEYEGDSFEDASFTFVKYSKESAVDASGKTILTYAAIYADSDIKDDIIEFNKSQSDYMVKLVDYADEEDPYAKFSADIAAGNYADIYDVYDGLGDISFDQAVEMGLFEDLTPYIEKDEDVNLDDLLPSIKDAIDIDGKCYFLPASFTLYTLVGRESDLGSEPSWSSAELMEYYNSKEDSRLFYSDNKLDILYNLLDGCGHEFIDWEKGECDFDNQEFKDILELANQGSDKEVDDEEVNEAEDYKDGTILFNDGSLSLDNLIKNQRNNLDSDKIEC